MEHTLQSILHDQFTSCTQMLFCRNSRESVVEYLVGIPNVKLTYAGKSDGSSILHLAYRYGLRCVCLIDQE